LSFFGGTNLDYSESGDTATLKGKNSNGEDFEFQLKYDSSSDSAVLTSTINGTVDEIVSICVDDDYYAKTYWSPEYGNTQVIYYIDGTMYMCWDNAPVQREITYTKTQILQPAVTSDAAVQTI
jgi:hypothetical protein